jgi:hypothetical protein
MCLCAFDQVLTHVCKVASVQFPHEVFVGVIEFELMFVTQGSVLRVGYVVICRTRICVCVIVHSEVCHKFSG